MGKVVSAVKSIFTGPQAPKMPKMPKMPKVEAPRMPDMGSYKAKQAASKAVEERKRKQGGGRDATIYTASAYRNSNLGGTQ